MELWQGTCHLALVLLAHPALPHGCEWVLFIVVFRVLKYMKVYRTEHSQFPEDEEGEGRRKEAST